MAQTQKATTPNGPSEDVAAHRRPGQDATTEHATGGAQPRDMPQSAPQVCPEVLPEARSTGPVHGVHWLHVRVGA